MKSLRARESQEGLQLGPEKQKEKVPQKKKGAELGPE